MSVEGVKAAMVLDDEPYGPGSVGLVILGEAGQPTPQLLADVEDYVRMRQPLGVARMVASGATITDVNLALTVMRFSNADRTTVENAVTAALEAYGDGLQLGESMVLSRMIAAVQAVDGVYSVDFTSPSTNVGAAPTEYLNVDSITITHQIKRRTYHDSAIDGGLGEAVSSIDPIDQSEWTI
jgi:phage-related baseplate assembly protein